MPAMVRPRGQAKKIAYRILGTPSNMSSKQTRKERRVSKKLNREYTRLVR